MMRFAPFLVVAGLWSCSEEEQAAPPACTPGDVIVCPCPGGETGQQTCLAGGSQFGSCEQCSGEGGGGGGAGGGGGGSGGATDAGGGGVAGTGGSGGEGGAVAGCDSPRCDTCIASRCATSHCQSEIAACEANSECAAFEACVAGCTSPECATDCSGQHTGGVADSSAKTNCLYCSPETCQAQCDPGMMCM